MDLLSFRLLFIGTVVLSRGDKDVAHCVWVCRDTDLVAQDEASPTQREKELSISIWFAQH